MGDGRRRDGGSSCKGRSRGTLCIPRKYAQRHLLKSPLPPLNYPPHPQVQQQRDRHRLKLHSEVNVMSHTRVVSGSIVETAFFIAAALFQIFFVRRWFSAKIAQGGKSRV